MRLVSRNAVWLAPMLLAGAVGVAARAQTMSPTSTNAMLRLLLSQPPVDISSPVTTEASFDPPVVRPGELSIYRVTVSAIESSIHWTGQIAAPPLLTMRASAHGEIMRPARGAWQPYASFVYDARAAEAGSFVVPSFTVEVYGKPVVIPEARLEVRTDLDASHEPARQLEVETEVTNAFVGEPVGVRVRLPASMPNVIQGLAQVEINGDGFLTDKSSVRQSIEPTERNGRRVTTFVYETTVIPIAAGELSLSAQGFTAGHQFTAPIIIRGQATLPAEPPQYVLLDSVPATLRVRPLPADGQLPGFTGAVGSFRCEAPELSGSTILAGEPVELTVTVRGEGDLARLVPPPPPQAAGWQAFQANPGTVVQGPGPQPPAVRFTYTLIPTSDKVRATPAIPFSCFDPKRAAYVDLTIPPVPVSVTPNGRATMPLQPADHEFAAPKKPALSELARTPGRRTDTLVPPQRRVWFPFVQLAPAFALAGLWSWDRRRRYLEQHPEIVRRRIARRDLRKQKRRLDRAAARGDGPAFAQGAVAAMKIACGPWHSANPQALVCGDVLDVLTAAERRGRAGEIVRRFFAAADAASFSETPPSDGQLLNSRSELDELLAKLEERL